jgi:hypothetical protein
MIRTQVYIPEDLHRELMLLSKREGKNFSTLIREGATAVVEKKKIKRDKNWGKDFIGACKSKVKTNAVKDIRDYYLHHAV